MKKERIIFGSLHAIIARFVDRKEAKSGSKRKDYYRNKLEKARPSDEVKIINGVAHYYFWDHLLAKWDGKILWLDNDGFSNQSTSYRLSDIFNIVYSRSNTTKDEGWDNKFHIGLSGVGFYIRPAWAVDIPYPVEMDMVNFEFVSTDFKTILFDKFLRARENAGRILEAIEKLDVEIPEDYQAKFKAKKLKLIMDGFKFEM